MKRLIVILLSVLLVVQLTSIPAFAAEHPGVHYNNSYKVTLNRYIASTKYSFRYDKATVTIKASGKAYKEHTTMGTTYEVSLNKTGNSYITDSQPAGNNFQFYHAYCYYYADSMYVWDLSE